MNILRNSASSWSLTRRKCHQSAYPQQLAPYVFHFLLTNSNQLMNYQEIRYIYQATKGSCLFPFQFFVTNNMKSAPPRPPQTLQPTVNLGFQYGLHSVRPVSGHCMPMSLPYPQIIFNPILHLCCGLPLSLVPSIVTIIGILSLFAPFSMST